jgi:hypothetical protein
MTKVERPWLTTWGEVINSMSTVGSDDLVYFDGGPESPSDPCLVIDGMDLDPDEDVPQEAAERGWNTELGVDSIRGVIDNLRLQLGHSADITLILRAVAHYVDNDAFLTVE